jgi:hypothetical protein
MERTSAADRARVIRALCHMATSGADGNWVPTNDVTEFCRPDERITRPPT